MKSISRLSFAVSALALLALCACGGGAEDTPLTAEQSELSFAEALGATGVDADALPTAGHAQASGLSRPAQERASKSGPGETAYVRSVSVDNGNPAASDSGPGNAAMPYRTIGAAMRALRPGDDVVVGPGTYREWLVVPVLNWGTAQTRLRARMPRTAIIKGSDEVAGWTSQSGGVYAVQWLGEEPQQLFRGSLALKQIGGTVFGGYPNNGAHELAAAHASEGGIWPGRVPGAVAALVADSFTYDALARRLFVKLASPITATQTLEVSVRRHVLQAENARGLTIEGLDFAHANTSFVYRQGAVKVQGDGNVLKDLVVRDMDAACVQLVGNDSALLSSTLVRCGQLGLRGFGNRMNISKNVITYANTRGFNKWWEAGGMKFIGNGGLHAAVIRGNVVAYGNGDGIWIDWMNTQNLIEGNTVAYNSGFGIQYEASQSATVRANLAYGNGLRGIYLLESAGCLIEGNTVFGNALEGIAVVDGERSVGDARLRPQNNQITGNALAWNDQDRNWVQLVVPGSGYGSVSDRNSFRAERLGPRMSLGFVSGNNPAYERLADWRYWAQFDLASVEQTLAMPAALQAALSARRLVAAAELPAYLAAPGPY